MFCIQIIKNPLTGNDISLPFFSFSKKQSNFDSQMLASAGPFGLTDGNNRGTQNLNGRYVEFFDLDKSDCYPKPEATQKPRGHYEKVDVKSTKYIYIPNDEPSGLENSYIVSESEAIDRRRTNHRRRRR